LQVTHHQVSSHDGCSKLLQEDSNYFRSYATCSTSHQDHRCLGHGVKNSGLKARRFLGMNSRRTARNANGFPTQLEPLAIIPGPYETKRVTSERTRILSHGWISALSFGPHSWGTRAVSGVASLPQLCLCRTLDEVGLGRSPFHRPQDVANADASLCTRSPFSHQ